MAYAVSCFKILAFRYLPLKTLIMKTKLLFTIVLFTSFFMNVFSQEYHPVLNNTTWIVTRHVSCCIDDRTVIFVPGAQTVIGDYTYTAYADPLPQLDSNLQSIPTVYLREDILGHKVYKLVQGVDTLLYDYNMETGDTISQYGYNWTVSEVDEIETNAGPRKRITLLAHHSFSNYVKQIWIEGMGTNKHPFYPQQNMTAPFLSGSGGTMIYIDCVYQNEAHVFGNGDCASMLSTTYAAEGGQKVVFSPNPVATELTIDSQSALQNASLKIYNTQGQLVKEVSNFSGKKLTVRREKLCSGLYLAQLFEEGKLIKTSKLVVE
jgi:Secretion system C-terminal sorting domain